MPEEIPVAPINVKPASDAASEGSRKTLAFYEDAKGNIDVDRLQDRTKAQIRRLIQDKALPAKLGIAGATPGAPAVQFISPELAGGLYDIVGSIESLLAQRFFGCSSEIASRAFTFDEAKKKALVPLTCKVANKYASEWMQQYGDEIMLAMIFVTMTTSQIMAMKSLQAGKVPIPEPIKVVSMQRAETEAPPHPTSVQTETIDAFAEVPAEPTEKIN